MNKSVTIPQVMQQYYKQLTEITDSYCKEFLTDEYAQLARSAIAALCRKRSSPLISGSTKVWACGVIYALGQANFLFDSSQNPHVTPSELCYSFSVSKSTAGNKAKLIRDMLKIDFYNHKWKLLSQMENSSFVWLVMLDDCMVDIRHESLELQYKAYEKGLIPYVPGLQSPLKK